MNGMHRGNSRREREQRLSRILLVVTAIVFFCGLFGQIALRSQISDLTKKKDALDAEIEMLTANAGNLDMNINQRHNLIEIEKRAKVLGMEDPSDGQLRTLSLPAAYGNTSTQTVANGSGEELNG